VLTTFTTTKLMYGWAQTYEAPCMMDAWSFCMFLSHTNG
jgi:hypothetical protein